jgi:hypothetical protein
MPNWAKFCIVPSFGKTADQVLEKDSLDSNPRTKPACLQPKGLPSSLPRFSIRNIYPVPSTARPEVSRMSDGNVTVTQTSLYLPVLRVLKAWLCSTLSSRNPLQSFGQ